MWTYLSEGAVKGEEDRFAVVLNEFKRLAQGYVPEWNMETEFPDIGAAIALIFTGEMETLRELGERLPQLCMEQMAGTLGVKARPCVPARTILVMDMDPSAKTATFIPKSSRFFAENTKTETTICFETTEDCMAIPALLEDIFFISAGLFKVISYKEAYPDGPWFLFSQEGREIGHETIEIRHPFLPKGAVCLDRPEKALYADILGARIRGGGRNISPDFVYDGNQELTGRDMAVFGQKMEPYKECYIGCDTVFEKAGAEVVCTFSVGWKTYDSRNLKDQPETLKPVMRRPKKEESPPVQVYVQDISITYFNGKGFKRLDCKGKDSLISYNEKDTVCRLSFCNPDDWIPMEVGGYEERCLRLQIQQVKNSYIPEAIHRYPTLSNIEFSYTLGENGISPDSIIRRRGNQLTKLTQAVRQGGGTALFPSFPYKEEAILFGFDRPFPEGGVCLYLELESRTKEEKIPFECLYSTENGFEVLQFTEQTDGLTQSGILRFLIPEDAENYEVEGQKRFWLKLQRLKGGKIRQLPKLTGVRLNVAEAVNNGINGCDGADGNIDKKTIMEPARSYPSLNQVYNLIPAFGGRGKESREQVFKRERDCLASGNRIVSALDVIRLVQGFSQDISQAVLLTEAGTSSLVILMETPESGGFERIRDDLFFYLKEKCPFRPKGVHFQIREPIFVKLSVSLWIQAHMEEVFEIQKKVPEKIAEYLQPEKKSGRQQTEPIWGIGRLPELTELEYQLNQFVSPGNLLCFQAVLTYTDETGRHEKGLEEAGPMPDAVCVNGEHRIQIEIFERKSHKSVFEKVSVAVDP